MCILLKLLAYERSTKRQCGVNKSKCSGMYSCFSLVDRRCTRTINFTCLHNLKEVGVSEILVIKLTSIYWQFNLCEVNNLSLANDKLFTSHKQHETIPSIKVLIMPL